jgi:outer membrane protein
MTLHVRAARVSALSSFMFFACATSYLDRAPPSPTTAWRPASGDPHDFSLAPEVASPRSSETGTTIESERVYGLPELIDIAESANPDTRIGWERARRAALSVGIAKAAYLPTISALALGGFRHTSYPAPNLKNLVINPSELAPGVTLPLPPLPTGRVGVDTFDVLPFVAIRWQVLDFGRGAGVDAAEHASVAANVSFTGEHQKIVYEVTRAYLRLSAARAQTAVARDALEHTRAIAKAAQARFARGLATRVQTVEGSREVAQAEYDLAQAEAAETTVYTALLSTMGVDPLLRLKVATNRSRELPPQLAQNVDDYLRAALKTRPDLQAAIALNSSAHALVEQSKATFLPRMSLTGTAGAAVLGARIDGSSFTSSTLPNVGALVSFEWLLFDAGVRSAQTEIARSHENETGQTVAKVQLQAAHEVVSAYDGVNASLARYQAASSLERTAAVAEDSVTKSYENGLSTLTEALSAQKARALASGAKEQAFAEALISATTLAFASGQLGSAKAVPDLRN